jgi:1-acyl-sn-glycerol-3-phosphate acyltransferase
MKLQAVKLALYSLWLTNYYGIKLKMAKEPAKKRQIRLEYAKTLLAKLQIDIDVKNISKLPSDGKFLLVSNHRGIIDPLVVEMALQNSSIYGLWVSKRSFITLFSLVCLLEMGALYC